LTINRDADRRKVFGRRAIVLSSGKVALVGALLGRMHYLQVTEADQYRMLAEENRINLRLLAPPRGRVVDRFGEPLAITRQNFRVLIVSEQTSDLAKTLNTLGQIIKLSAYQKESIQKEVRRRKRFVPVTVRENLNWEEMVRIEVNAPDLPGIIVDEGLTRFYPHNEMAAHVLGYVSSVDESDLTGDSLLQLPGFRIGKAGVEQKFDLALRGTGGTSQVEVNAVGRVIRELERKEGQSGIDLQLTLDQRLQQFSSRRLEPESAACVVMDVNSGEVLVMASTPGFDPNAFNRGLTQEEWSTLSNDPRAPMTNKAMSGQYSPGSTFKMIVALAVLEQKVISPEQKIMCKGHVDLGNRRFHCWEHKGHQGINMVQAIAQSCDVYFYEVARRIGVDRIASMAGRLGLGKITGLDIPGERAGLIPTEAWKRRVFNEAWQQGETYNVGIGQGYVLTTPLQLAVMTSRIATGLEVEPLLTRQSFSNNNIIINKPKIFGPLMLDRSHLAIVRSGMFEVLNGERGTARGSKLNINGLQMSGKTGTTQVKRITMAEREAGLPDIMDIPWKDRTHALFVAYAPSENPRYALSVIVEHGGGGSSVAAPIARDIMSEVLKLDPVSSSQDPPSASPGLDLLS
jgi:penicillin-binding protein 2